MRFRRGCFLVGSEGMTGLVRMASEAGIVALGESVGATRFRAVATVSANLECGANEGSVERPAGRPYP